MKIIQTVDCTVDHIDEDGDYEMIPDNYGDSVTDFCIAREGINTDLRVGDRVRITITLLQEK